MIDIGKYLVQFEAFVNLKYIRLCNKLFYLKLDIKRKLYDFFGIRCTLKIPTLPYDSNCSFDFVDLMLHANFTMLESFMSNGARYINWDVKQFKKIGDELIALNDWWIEYKMFKKHEYISYSTLKKSEIPCLMDQFKKNKNGNFTISKIRQKEMRLKYKKYFQTVKENKNLRDMFEMEADIMLARLIKLRRFLWH
jgi:hypothetical protein